MDLEVNSVLEASAWTGLLSSSSKTNKAPCRRTSAQTAPVLSAIFNRALPFSAAQAEDKGELDCEVRDGDLVFSRKKDDDLEDWKRRKRIGLRRLYNGLTSPDLEVQDRALAAVAKNMSLAPSGRMQFSLFPEIMDALVSHAGIYKSCQLRRVMEQAYSKRLKESTVGFLEYWLSTQDDMLWKLLLCEKYMQKVDYTTLRTVSLEMWVAQDDPVTSRVEKEFIVRRPGLLCSGTECKSCICKTPYIRGVGGEFERMSASHKEVWEYLRNKVELIASVMKNFSELEENAKEMAKCLSVLRFAMLIAKDKDVDTRLARLAYDTLRNMGLYLTLHYPLEQYPITTRITGILRLSLRTQERFRVLGALELITKLGKNPTNERILMRYRPHLLRIAQFLNKRDVAFVFHSLEALYTYSCMGTAMCNWLSEIAVINLLVNLLGVQVVQFQEKVAPPVKKGVSPAANQTSVSSRDVSTPASNEEPTSTSAFRSVASVTTDNRQRSHPRKVPETQVIVEPGQEEMLRKRIGFPTTGPAAKLYKSMTSPKFEELIAKTSSPKIITVRSMTNHPVEGTVLVHSVPHPDLRPKSHPKVDRQAGKGPGPKKTQVPPAVPAVLPSRTAPIKTQVPPPVPAALPSRTAPTPGPSIQRQVPTRVVKPYHQLTLKAILPATYMAMPPMPPTSEPSINLEYLCQLYSKVKADHLIADQELVNQIHRTAALILRNMANYSRKARSIIRAHVKNIVRIALSEDPCSSILVNLLFDLATHDP